MRFLFLVLLFSISAVASEIDNSKDLKDILYIPSQFGFYGETSIGQSDYELTVDKTTETRLSTTNFHQKVGFGLTNSFSLALDYVNQLEGENDTEVSGANSPKVKTTGHLNPTLSVLYRLLNQNSDSINLDLMASYSPDLFDSEISSSSHDVDAASGGAVYTMGARAGKKFKNFQMAAEGYLDIIGETSVKNRSTNSTDKGDAYAQARIYYHAQTNVLPILDVRGNVGVITASEQVSKASGTKTTVDMLNAYEFGPTMIFIVIPNQLNVNFDWNMRFYKNYEQKVGSNTQEIKDFRGHDIKLSAQYQF
ncbi:MAG: hypothetical protein K2P81_05100 [Bacteriovoracaceae bacterium]|nr:hypothetical protein [Bacteriovoracaceae bacterium]